MKTGLVHKWKKNAWMRNRRDKVLNVDLWEQLLAMSTQQDVSFDWVRGHRGHTLNERCDRVALNAARQPDLPPDAGYEQDHAPPTTSYRSSTPRRTVEERAQRGDDERAHKILAVLYACRDDSDAKRVEYDDSDGFQVYTATPLAAWRYKFRNLDTAYALVQKNANIRSYRAEV